MTARGVDKARLGAFLGTVSEAKMRRVCNALAIEGEEHGILANVILQKFEATGLVQGTRQVSLEERRRS